MKKTVILSAGLVTLALAGCSKPAEEAAPATEEAAPAAEAAPADDAAMKAADPAAAPATDAKAATPPVEGAAAEDDRGNTGDRTP